MRLQFEAVDEQTFTQNEFRSPVQTTRILAIDDTPYNLDILKNGLKDEGFDVLTASSGPTGLQMVDEKHPDLVLLDIGMPEMDGHEVLKRLRKSDIHGDLPVIILTANNEDGSLARCLASGANDYITKPFSFTVLVARINNVLRTLKEAQNLNSDVEKLKGIAYRDELTGLLNRRAFFERASAEFSIAVSSNAPLSVAILDIDHFKKINDTFGHPAGDEVLATFGRILEANFRAHDIVGRIGGEEFAVCLPGSPAVQAYNALERVRAELEQSELLRDSDGVAHPVTVSSGVVAMNGQEDLDSLMVLADTALYRAKNQGRNRTIVETGISNIA